MKPVPFEFSSLLDAASRKSGGEGENHRLLKEFVAKHPEAIGLPKGTPKGEMERSLPSGDSLDVSFQVADHWICAEVKSSVSTTDDIVRGLFQCVKYRAVMEAVQRAGAFQQNARAILILENTFPAHLIALKHILGVEVVDLISPY